LRTGRVNFPLTLLACLSTSLLNMTLHLFP
jgi:hypothetical protein